MNSNESTEEAETAEDDPFTISPAQRKREAAHMIAAMAGFAGPEIMRGILPRPSSADKRHDPDRPKTEEDIERIEAARKKRERKERRRAKSKENQPKGNM